MRARKTHANYNSWINSLEISDEKRETLQKIKAYRDQTSLTRAANRNQICEDIFEIAHFPDILFFKYVKDELLKIPEIKSELRTKVLPDANRQLLHLMTPYINQTEKAAMGLMFLVVTLQVTVSSQVPAGFLILVANLLTYMSVQATEKRIEISLYKKVLEERSSGLVPESLDDGFNDVLGYFMQFAEVAERKFMEFGRRVGFGADPVSHRPVVASAQIPVLRSPAVDFSTKDKMTLSLSAYQEWMIRANISNLKQQVLQKIIDNVDASYKCVDACKKIFAAAHMPDILFLEIAQNEIQEKHNRSNGFFQNLMSPSMTILLRTNVLPLVEKHKKLLMMHYEGETQKANVGLGVLSLALKFSAGLGNGAVIILLTLAATNFIAPNFSTERRVRRATQNRLYAESKHADSAPLVLGDGLDDFVSHLVNYQATGRRKLLSFINSSGARVELMDEPTRQLPRPGQS
jgi:hypothetical protein